MRPAAACVAIACAALAGCGSKAPPPVQTAPRPAPLAAPRVVPGSLDVRALLVDLPERAQRFGAGPMSLVASGEAYEGERLGAFIDVPADACLLGYARASSSIEDLDVAIFSDEGTPLAVDEAPDTHPAVLLCPPHPDRVYMTAHAAAGEGLVALAAHVVPRDRASEVGMRVGARGSVGGPARDTGGWPGLDDIVRSHRLALGGAWEDFRRVALPVDARSATQVAFPIDAGQCTDAIVVPGEEVSLLEVEALDGEGRVIGRAHEGGRVRTLTVCSPIQVTGTIEVRPHAGRGLAAVVLAHARGDASADLASRPEIAWAAPTKPVDATRADRDATLAKLGYARGAQAGAGALALGRRTTVPVDLRGFGGGKCARVDVIAGAPLALVEANLWDDAGALVGAGEGSASLTLFACSGGSARLDLETRGRPGPFAALLRPEPWSDPTFAAHPLAAARMLRRAAVGPDALFEGTAGAVRALAIDDEHVAGWNVSVAAGKCLRVAAGAQGEGGGLELRVFDVGTGDEVDRSHAADSAAVRACASAGAPKQVRVELRATSGKLDAVVGERVY